MVKRREFTKLRGIEQELQIEKTNNKVVERSKKESTLIPNRNRLSSARSWKTRRSSSSVRPSSPKMIWSPQSYPQKYFMARWIVEIN